jgi:hypothetical protein
MPSRYTRRVARTIPVELDENELKLLLVAIRQVKHTFSIAEAQSQAAGEPLDPQYQPLQDLYIRLEQKLSGLMGEASPEKPFRIK